jgi:hypothetical protein
MKLRDILNESKQVGLLYYFTNENDYEKILKTNKLYPTIEGSPKNYQLSSKYKIPNNSTYAFVSMSRDKYFYKSKLHKLEKRIVNIRLTIDGEKLSNKYKIIPYNWVYRETHDHHDEVSDEKEERILTITRDGISNINEYIIKVDKV